jgi:hypothetical protein
MPIGKQKPDNTSVVNSRAGKKIPKNEIRLTNAPGGVVRSAREGSVTNDQEPIKFSRELDKLPRNYPKKSR